MLFPCCNYAYSEVNLNMGLFLFQGPPSICFILFLLRTFICTLNYYYYYKRFTCSQYKVPEHVSSTDNPTKKEKINKKKKKKRYSQFKIIPTSHLLLYISTSKFVFPFQASNGKEVMTRIVEMGSGSFKVDFTPTAPGKSKNIYANISSEKLC